MTEFVRPLKIENLNTSGLTEDEKRKLQQVLAKNNQVASHENTRLNRLNREIRSDFTKYVEKEHVIPSQKCLVCSRDIKTGFDGCEKCGKRVCRKCCLEYGTDEIMLCKVCYKQMLLDAKAAKWFYKNKIELNYDNSDNSNKSKAKNNQNIAENDDVIEMTTTGIEHASINLDTNSYDELLAKMLEYENERKKSKKGSTATRRKVTGGKDINSRKESIKPSVIGADPQLLLSKINEKENQLNNDFVRKLIEYNRELKKANKTK